ncbi:MAG: hypothetical protein MUQ30_01635, partial [Anaerolineae bacterium]|nr:hypothetical protein [Anaerolineae bacterium]
MNSKVPSLVVGIAGGSASGKSTFTAALLEALPVLCPGAGVRVMHSDRYFRVGTPEMPMFVSPSSGKRQPDMNHPDSIDTQRMLVDLDALARAEDAPDILILEGHLVLCWPEVR